MKLAVLLIAACTLAPPAAAETLLVGPGTPEQLRDALLAARDGDVIDLLPGDYRGVALVLPPKKITLRGAGQRPVFNGDGKVGEARAIFLVQGGELTLENIEFRGVRAQDGNGAGVRLEGGRLTVRRCAFFDNERGIYATNAESAELEIADSVFADAPPVVGGLHHLVDIGRIAKVSISGSRFHHGFEGHLLKSRARETRITYNLLYDGPDGQTSYEIDLPNGGAAWIIGNVIGQAAGSQNPVVVAYGADGGRWQRNVLYMAHNTLINDKLLPAWFLRVFKDRVPGGVEVHAINNLTVGGGLFGWAAPGHFEGNWPANTGALADPGAWAFELAAGSWLRGRGVDPRHVGGQDLSPTAEFTLPVGTKPLPALQSWTPGAFQR